MSKTDKTMPARLKEQDAENAWRQHRYVSYAWLWGRGKDSWSKREVRRYWHSERFKARNAIRLGRDPEPSRHRHYVQWDRW